ncbi:hypothetical protein [Pedobacter sp. UBA5917]|uniref:hypothetical protein n=1 Tax=Pedobacter sp. UBA5917 TaxID=1947061 RepID=UPI0025CDA7A3|nr:hypothetical protein [Pedobacter sp. UBA5917]
MYFYPRLISPDGSVIPFGKDKAAYEAKFPKGFSVQQDRTQRISTGIALQENKINFSINDVMFPQIKQIAAENFLSPIIHSTSSVLHFCSC